MKSHRGRNVELGIQVMHPMQAPEERHHVHQVMGTERAEPPHGKRDHERDSDWKGHLIQEAPVAVLGREGHAHHRYRVFEQAGIDADRGKHRTWIVTPSPQP
jgi:hypothetical protein